MISSSRRKHRTTVLSQEADRGRYFSCCPQGPVLGLASTKGTWSARGCLLLAAVLWSATVLSAAEKETRKASDQHETKAPSRSVSLGQSWIASGSKSKNSSKSSSTLNKKSASGLRWGSRRLSSFRKPSVKEATPVQSKAAQSKATKTPIATVSLDSKDGLKSVLVSRLGTIAQVAHLAPINPFDDPFGEALAQVTTDPASTPSADDLDISPDADTAGVNDLPRIDVQDTIGIPNGNVEPEPIDPLFAQPETGIESDVNAIEDLGIIPIEPLSPLTGDELGAYTDPEDFESTTSTAADCPPEDCAEDLLDLHQPLSSISLDATPRFFKLVKRTNPTTGLEEDVELNMDDELAKEPTRTWTDRAGRVLIEGRIVNYTNRRVVVGTSDGRQVKFETFNLSDADMCYVHELWDLPAVCSLGDVEYQTRSFTPITYVWTASNLSHYPLYFEEIALERYGHSAGPLLQPVLSGGHFFGSVLALPYSMGLNPPHECMFDLGYYRPGSCAPYIVPPVPLSLRAGLTAGAAGAGLGILVP